MKIDFSQIVTTINFAGDQKVFDVRKILGNLMMYSGSTLMDIGFEKLAESIYFSKGEINVPVNYIPAMKAVILESTLVAALKRELTKLLEAVENDM